MFYLLIIPILILIYSKFIDIFKPYQLFYVMSSVYATFFAFISYAINSPMIINSSFIKSVSWAIFFMTESFGALVITLFWSFAANICTPESAKKGYASIIVGSQIGALLGPLLAWNAQTLGMRILFGMATLGIIALMLIIKQFVKVMPEEQLVRNPLENIQKHKKGLFKGLRLLLTKPYLLGIFAIVSIHGTISLFVDYQIKTQAYSLIKYNTIESFSSFLGMLGITTNGIAIIIALIGTSYFLKKLGIQKALLVLPLFLFFTVAIVTIFSLGNIITPSQITCWAFLGIMIIIQSLSHAFNAPTKEILYIPTSKNAKFKTKAWIDIFGRKYFQSAAYLLAGLPLLYLGLIGVWIVVAIFVGQQFHKLTKEGKIIS